MSRFTHASIVRFVIDIPGELAEAQEAYNGAAGRAFIAALPDLAAGFLHRWRLTLDGPSMNGVSALVLPVVRADGLRAVLKLQLTDAESVGKPVALRVWDGDGAVRLLDHDPATGTMLLERLDESRMLAGLGDTREAVLVIARLLAHLTSFPAPPGLRRLGDIAEAMLERTPSALKRVPDPGARRILADCAAAVREVVHEPGDRLLHWDLHDENARLRTVARPAQPLRRGRGPLALRRDDRRPRPGPRPGPRLDPGPPAPERPVGRAGRPPDRAPASGDRSPADMKKPRWDAGPARAVGAPCRIRTDDLRFTRAAL